MKTIPLTQGKFTIVDDDNYDHFNQWKWYANKWGNIYYAVRHSRKSESEKGLILMHRVILNAPDGVEVDHRDGNGLNNQILNLRLCNHAENQRHQRLSCRNKTGFKGVMLNKRATRRPYYARIRVNNKQIYLGCRETAIAAAQAYDAAAVEHHGEFALTNKMLGLL